MWLGTPLERRWFAVLAPVAYYDASSKEEVSDRPLVVAGLLADQPHWEEFDREWERVLTDEGVTHFHMKDFMPSWGEFSSWRGNEARRDGFMRRLIGLMHDYELRAFTYRIFPRDFNAVNSEYALGREYASGAYAVAAHGCMREVDLWLQANHPDAGVYHLVSKGDTGQGDLVNLRVRMLQAYGDCPMQVLPAKNDRGEWFHPFGACDLVAWEHRAAIERMTGGRFEPPPWFELLLDSVPHVPKYTDEQSLRETCEGNPEIYPRRS